MPERSEAGRVVEQTERDLAAIQQRRSGFGRSQLQQRRNHRSGDRGGERRDSRSYFPDTRAVIVHADGGSKDGTVERALEAAAGPMTFLQVPFRIYPVDKLSDDLTAMPGKASALQTIFRWRAGSAPKPAWCVSGATRGVTPEWVDRLARPGAGAGLRFRGALLPPAQIRRRHRQRHTVSDDAGAVWKAAAAARRRRVRRLRPLRRGVPG